MGDREILIFGLSANPPTGYGGHAGLVKLLADKRRFDEIWILPVYKHIYETKNKKLIDFEHRMELCRLNFEDLSSEKTKVIVKDFEKQVYELMETERCVSRDDGSVFPEPKVV